MKKYASVGVPIILLVVFASAMGLMRHLMTLQTVDHEKENAELAKEEQKKKATKELGRTAVVETNKGTIKFVLYEKDTPISSGNFIKLAQRKFYDGSSFHRYEPGFVIQGGKPKDPRNKADNIVLEVKEGLSHVEGAVGMARSDDPNSASSEFYITLKDVPSLDMNYAVFGQVVEGMDVVKKLRKGDLIKSVRIVKTTKVPPVREKADHAAHEHNEPGSHDDH